MSSVSNAIAKLNVPKDLQEKLAAQCQAVRLARYGLGRLIIGERSGEVGGLLKQQLQAHLDSISDKNNMLANQKMCLRETRDMVRDSAEKSQ